MLNIFYPAVLCLDDGTIYKGWSFFKTLVSFGEIVFNTGMTGYQEIMTDPSYSGQIVAFTYPELGNTGLNYKDNESSFIHIKGIIAKNICINPSNWRSRISLKEYILIKKIPHIFGLDTRALTRYIRLKGVMQGYIASQMLDISTINSSQQVLNVDLVKRVTNPYISCFNSSFNYINTLYSYLNYTMSIYKNQKNQINIVIIDFGVKNNILLRLLSYGCNIYILPATSDYNMITKYNPDGILLSNGPGDPSIVNYSINTIKKLIHYSYVPIFGICMGHQLLNLALDRSTFKLKFGHRGLNHPSGLSQYSEITSQNHGFAVHINSLNENYLSQDRIIQITHFNLNDLTVGGILHNYKPIFSVQYHPEASPGPHDSDYLFRSFIELISIFKKKNK
uniref:Carbamoyl phosphate synthase small chain n=1 Tax=Apoglossum ruscifolium TaxID=167976 RepID=A0A4D6WLE0_9FLOR|nr:Carbamoyl phosphate synthase small subunit [Apoglossum ruscifolium]